MSEPTRRSSDRRDAPATHHPEDDPRSGNLGRAAEAPKPEGLDDVLDEASAESFPASDPPAWSAAPTVGEARPEPSVKSGRHGLGHVVDDADGGGTAEG